jgi:hypothetical protein
VTIDEIRHLYDSDSIPTIDMNNNHLISNKTNRTPVKQPPSPLPLSNGIENYSKKFISNFFFEGNNAQQTVLIEWCEEIVDSYAIEIKNDSKAFENSLAFCAIIHHYRPDLMYAKTLNKKKQYPFVYLAISNHFNPIDRLVIFKL